MSAQAIYDIFSAGNIGELSIKRIPPGPKSNCYFILNMGRELTEYSMVRTNRMKFQDRLRDGTGAWSDISVNNATYYLVENGVLKWVESNLKKNIKPIYNLRAHRATYTDKAANFQEPSKKSVFWFWNSPDSPAPGIAIVSYLGPAYSPRSHGNAKDTHVPYTRSAHQSIDIYRKRHSENTRALFQEQMLQSDIDEFSPPRNRQQIADAQHRERKECGLADKRNIKSFNCAQVCY